MATIPQDRLSTIEDALGARIRECRTMRGLNQRELAEKIGVSSQQVHRYEVGENSISAAELYGLARVLGVPVTHFYEGLEGRNPRPASLHQRRLLELVRVIGEIHDKKDLAALAQLTRTLAGR